MAIYTDPYQTKSYHYAYDIVNGNIIACKDVINACNRFINDLERSESEDFPFYFDCRFADRIEILAKNFKFPNGVKVGEPIVLDNSQAFCLEQIFCWRFKDNPKKRRYRSALMLKARKNAKSFDMSFLAILSMMDEPDGQVFSAAGKYSQASISHKSCKSLIATNSDIANKFKLMRSDIILKSNGSTFSPLASESKTMDGLNPSMVLIDEFMIVDEDVRNSLISGMGGRVNPLMCYISTAYAVPDLNSNWGWQEVCYARDINSGKLVDERYFGICYSLDDASEVSNMEMWRKANPLYDASDSLREALQEDYKKACVNPKLMENFLIKNMNVFANDKGTDRYLPMSAWQQLNEKFVEFNGRDVFVGVDMSLNTDITALTFMFYDDYNMKYKLRSHAFIPSNRVDYLSAKDQVDYRAYEEQGYVTFINGDVIQASMVYEHIKQFEELNNCNIAAIGYDPYSSEELLNLAEQDGRTVIVVKQSYRSLSAPIKSFREKVYMKEISHEHNPLLDWCMSNIVTVRDRANNEIFDKVKSSNRIDMGASTLFAYCVTDKYKDVYCSRTYDDMIF